MSQKSKIITGECATNYEVLKVFFPGDDEPCICVGTGNVERILYHTPRGVGDKHYVDAYSKDGTVIRYFNMDTIIFGKGE